MTYNVEAILNRYTEEQRKELIKEMRFMALFGGDTPQTEEDFVKWCEVTLKARKKI